MSGVNRLTTLADLPQLLRVEEAAAFLGVGKGTIYELIRRNQVPVVRLGRLMRVPRSALIAMVNAEAEP